MYRQRDKVGFTEKRGIPINSVVYKTCISADVGGTAQCIYIASRTSRFLLY